MNITFSGNSFDGFPGDLIALGVLWGVVWLAVLYRILTRADFDTPSKILWAMVVIFVPFFGVFLYWLAAPAPLTSRSTRKMEGVGSHSDVAGTPWAGNPGFTNEK